VYILNGCRWLLNQNAQEPYNSWEFILSSKHSCKTRVKWM